ncbi:MAG: uracil-DNA glycosylase [Verrucomicrobiota bacterium]
MAFQIDLLQQAAAQYLQICKNLGEKDIKLSKNAVTQLNTLKDRSINHKRPNSDSFRQEAIQKPAEVLTKETEVLESRQPTLSSGDKQKALDELSSEILENREFPIMFERAKNMVFGVGDINASIMFVGEAPGADEDEAGEPFVGKAGQLLTKMIEAMGLQRSLVYIANVVKYRPDMPEGSYGNRKPTPAELTASRPYIVRQVEIIRPHVIVGLGATALEGLLDIPKVGITRIRGKWHEFAGIPLMPTFHPAYLLRNPTIEAKRKVWEDLLEVMEKANMSISEKQRRFFVKK